MNKSDALEWRNTIIQIENELIVAAMQYAYVTHFKCTYDTRDSCFTVIHPDDVPVQADFWLTMIKQSAAQLARARIASTGLGRTKDPEEGFTPVQ